MAKVTCLVNRIDHLDFACDDVDQSRKLYERMGFNCKQMYNAQNEKKYLMVQGKIRFLLSSGQEGTSTYDYLKNHGEGVQKISFHCDDPRATAQLAVDRGAELASDYSVEEDYDRNRELRLLVKKSAIKGFGSLRFEFFKRSGPGIKPFDIKATFDVGFYPIEDFEDELEEPIQNVESRSLLSIDHLTNNVEKGKMQYWCDFYENIFGWEEARYFDIQGNQTGLLSKVMQSPDGAVKIPINEPKEDKSQIQEFLDEHKGPGVQHIALTTANIIQSVSGLRESGFEFLNVLDKYYDELKERLPHIKEDIDDLSKLRILADGDDKSYLLQIFTKNQVGPLFFEYIQRAGHNGFGEGNFQALFEAIERDQQERGVL